MRAEAGRREREEREEEEGREEERFRMRHTP